MDDHIVRWFVMRDLKRPNALSPAYRMLADLGFEVFLPMTWKISTRNGKSTRARVPFMSDLLFVHDSRNGLDPVVQKTPTLQYRFVKGGKYCEPMTVRDIDMNRFIRAVCTSDSPVFFLPEEISQQMLGHTVRIIGGPLDGYEGRLLAARGSRKRRLLVELHGLIATAVEVNPEFIQVIS